MESHAINFLYQFPMLFTCSLFSAESNQKRIRIAAIENDTIYMELHRVITTTYYDSQFQFLFIRVRIASPAKL